MVSSPRQGRQTATTTLSSGGAVDATDRVQARPARLGLPGLVLEAVLSEWTPRPVQNREHPLRILLRWMEALSLLALGAVLLILVGIESLILLQQEYGDEPAPPRVAEREAPRAR